MGLGSCTGPHTAPWTYPPGGLRRGEEGVQQHLRLLSQSAWLRTLGRKLGGILPGSAHALAGEYSPAMHVGAEHVRGASSPISRFLPCVSSSANGGPQTAHTSAAQHHSIQQQTASLLTTGCMLLSQGVMGQHCLRQCLRIERETVEHGML